MHRAGRGGTDFHSGLKPGQPRAAANRSRLAANHARRRSNLAMPPVASTIAAERLVALVQPSLQELARRARCRRPGRPAASCGRGGARRRRRPRGAGGTGRTAACDRAAGRRRRRPSARSSERTSPRRATGARGRRSRSPAGPPPTLPVDEVLEADVVVADDQRTDRDVSGSAISVLQVAPRARRRSAADLVEPAQQAAARPAQRRSAPTRGTAARRRRRR